MSTIPWHAHYAKPIAVARKISCQELKILQDAVSANHIVVVDVRRNDFEGFMITGAVNIPAQSFPMALKTWSGIFAARTIIFYCSSSKGRGPRAAAWYQDYLLTHNLPGESLVLAGGIKEWVNSYPDSILAIPDLS